MALDQSGQFRFIVASLEHRHPELKGKTLGQVPELADRRLAYRRSSYRWANVHFGFAIFNVIVAASPLVWVWPLNALAAGLAVWTMLVSEHRARVLTRQLNRPAIEQIARDAMGVED